MRKNDARQLDHATLEAMRERAVQSVQQGESPEDVARVLGINRSTIYKWLAEYRRGGWGALKAKPSHGATAVKASNLSELGPFHSVGEADKASQLSLVIKVAIIDFTREERGVRWANALQLQQQMLLFLGFLASRRCRIALAFDLIDLFLH
jgi:transposase-like protein